MAAVTYQNIHRRHPGAAVDAVHDLDLDIEDGELMVLVGPSGCGKSTSLRMLAGLEEVTAGQIHIGGREVTGLAPKDRDVAMVFQNYALYPHMTVADNIGFALKISGMAKEERVARVSEAAELLGLTEYLERKPAKLSGGQRQRVAMGRAIVRQPQVFCMDEPLSNLDAKLRVSTRTQIASLQRRLGTTTVYVTHDQVEAMTMGDRVAIMKDGVLQQVDTPLGIYDHPANAFVAGFIGSPAMNLVSSSILDGRAQVDGGEIPVARTVVPSSTDGTVQLGIRPESWQVVGADTPGAVRVQVGTVEELGSVAYAYGTVVGEASDVVVRVDRAEASRGSILHVTVRPEDVHVFDGVTGVRL